MSIAIIDAVAIAQGLKVRKNLQVPTLLFLGARAGALFDSQTLYNELHPSGQDALVPLDPTESFQTCIRLLTQNHFNETEIHSILLQSLPDTFVHNIDRYVAALTKLNLFRLVVTTNINASLEEALHWIGLQKNTDFDVFVPGTDTDSPIPSINKPATNESPPFMLVKPYGELAVGHYDLKQRGKFFEDSPQIYRQLRSMRNWNILMVGFDPVWDAAVIPLLLPCVGKLWYVNEEAPSQSSEIYKYLQLRNVECLLGIKGSSERFFLSLYQQIAGSAPLPPLPSRKESLPDKSTTSPSAGSSGIIPKLLPHKTKPLPITEHREHTQRTVEGRTCYDLANMRDTSVSLIQAGEEENTRATLGKQIEELAPACIIILGIVWGFQYKGQHLGDLLVSDQTIIYDIKEQEDDAIVNSGPYPWIPRERYLAPKGPLNLFKNGSIVLNRKKQKLASITFGPIFSSATPVNQETAFRFVSKKIPDVIGIEPDDDTLFSIAQTYQNNCLLVKGVAALVDDLRKQTISERKAMLEKAAYFILQVIVLGGFEEVQKQ